MSTQPRFLTNYTVADYQRWEGRWELIDGIAIAMTPSPFASHERVVSRLARLIGNQLDSAGCGCEVYTGLDWIVSDHTVVRPDLMVVCGEQPETHLQRPPTLVVEVLSEATKGRDLVVKRAIYLELGVTEYSIIDPDRRSIEFCRSDQSSVLESGVGRRLLSLGMKELLLEIDLKSIFP
ncbi:MAG: Uma2 family endonuclease [Planctomycetota bacterium]